MLAEEFCARCGELECRGSCGGCDAFHCVEALWPLQGNEGTAIYRLKRQGTQQSLFRFYSKILDPVVNAIEERVIKLGVSQVVVLPPSLDAFVTGRTHPNVLVFNEMKRRSFSRHSVFGRMDVAVFLMAKSERSRSLARSRRNSGMSSPWKRNQRWRSLIVLEKFGAESHKEETENHSILFFDDVLTTGFTASRAAALMDPSSQSSWHLFVAARSLKGEWR